jgi:hypothetical protein
MILSKPSNTSAAILTTLLYSDIFSFPLTKTEIWRYLISDKKIQRKDFEESLRQLSSYIVKKGDYYALKGKEEYIEKRIRNQSEVEKKVIIAEKIAALLRFIPTVQFIGISGGLAARNVTAEDDIDFFIIAKSNTVYITRFWVLLLLQLKGLRRGRRQKHAANKICVNLLIDEQSLSWAEDRRDIYTAREIAQIYPLFERSGTFKKFWEHNAWVTMMLPNADSQKSEPRLSIRQNAPLLTAALAIFPVELVMRYVQKWVMARHRTTEIVTNHRLAFHPKDYRAETLRQLKLKMRVLGLLTNI